MSGAAQIDRLHIGFFGRRNAGKSTFMNILAGQDISIVSDTKGTTTDPVRKAMEITGVGPCMLIDTAGIDDGGDLGDLRVKKTMDVIDETDLALIIYDLSCDNLDFELDLINKFREKNTPVINILGHYDINKSEEQRQYIEGIIKDNVYILNIDDYNVKDKLRRIVSDKAKQADDKKLIPSSVKKDSIVVLVMPQDIQAPKGRLILPQVQTIRGILDEKAVAICVTEDSFVNLVESLKRPPELIITDSSIFPFVKKNKPEESVLTSFSVLMADYKGDINVYKKGLKALETLNENSKILIAESCTHSETVEDIGRVKIPNLLRKKFGKNLKFDIVSGRDFPEDLHKYDLIIQCGGCMTNRKSIISRIEKAEKQNVPITNYGVLLAKLSGIDL